MKIISANDIFWARQAKSSKVTFHYLPKDPAKALKALQGSIKTALYDDDEERDSSGEWTSGGGSSPKIKDSDPADLGKARKAGDTHKLLEALSEPDGGFSVHDHIGDGPTTGYMVSMNKNTERAIDFKKLTHKSIADYMDDHKSELKDKNTYFGAWHNPDDGKVYLDVSTNFQDKKKAMEAAKKADQIAIFDLSNFSSLTTEASTARRRHFASPAAMRYHNAPVIPVYADAKTFPASDFHSNDSDGETCSRWNCNKPATQYRNTGQGKMNACAEHAKEMTASTNRRRGVELTSATDDVFFSGRPTREQVSRDARSRQAKADRQFPDWRKLADSDDDGTSDDFNGGKDKGPSSDGDEGKLPPEGPDKHSDPFVQMMQQQHGPGPAPYGAPPSCPTCGMPMPTKQSARRHAAFHQAEFEGSNADGSDPWDVRAENGDNSIGGDETPTDGADAQGDAAKENGKTSADNTDSNGSGRPDWLDAKINGTDNDDDEDDDSGNADDGSKESRRRTARFSAVNEGTALFL